jgi:hypothetical protein
MFKPVADGVRQPKFFNAVRQLPVTIPSKNS